MKHTFAKKVLLTVAVAISLSAVVPAYAMDYTRSLLNTAQNRAQALSGMSKDDLVKRLNNGVHNAIEQLRNLAKCAKSENGCSRMQIAAISSAVVVATAAATALTAFGISRQGGQLVGGQRLSKTEMLKKSKYGQKASEKATAAGNYMGTTKAGKWYKNRQEAAALDREGAFLAAPYAANPDYPQGKGFKARPVVEGVEIDLP